MKPYNYKGLEVLENDLVNTHVKLSNKGMLVNKFELILSSPRFKKFEKGINNLPEGVIIKNQNVDCDSYDGVINGLSFSISKIK